MLFVVFYVFIVSSAIGDESFHSFRESNKDTIDYSSLTTCWMYGAGRVEAVQGNPEMGHTCEVKLDSWTSSPKQAKELCESRLPYYIIKAEPLQNDETSCTFQVNLKCDTGYWQIKGKCYKVTESKYNWKETQNICKLADKSHQVAQYYSKNLALFFNQMEGIFDAWVIVPNMKDYYVNGKQLQEGVYVQDGAHKFDARKGSILMENQNSKHQALCEYTPPMTKAEMFYLANIYSEIYPFEIYKNGEGAIIPSASLMTIQQTEFIKETNISKFTTKHFNDVCMNLGKVLNVQSFPMTAIEEEFQDVKSLLKQQRFYLTNAYKNDGCSKGSYIQVDESGTNHQLYPAGDKNQDYCNAFSYSFERENRYPTMAGMRAPLLCALHTFNWEFTDCPPGPDWTEKPIKFIREDNRHFCHYINNGKAYTLAEAIDSCQKDGFGASLTGFDSADEFNRIRSSLQPKITYFLDENNKKYTLDNHYWLGGESPCEHDCDTGSGKKHVASWNNGVGVNTAFLNNYEHEGHPWETSASNTPKYVSFRSDYNAFHVHGLNEYPKMLSVCGKTAPLIRLDRLKGNLQNTAG